METTTTPVHHFLSDMFQDVWGEEVSYDGSEYDGLAEGEGKATVEHGFKGRTYFDGEWWQGAMVYGKAKRAKYNDQYKGEWSENGYWDGQGNYSEAAILGIYSGSFKQGQFHGHGSFSKVCSGNNHHAILF